MQKGHSRWKETKAKRWREGKTTGSTEAGTMKTKLVSNSERIDEVRKAEGE